MENQGVRGDVAYREAVLIAPLPHHVKNIYIIYNNYIARNSQPLRQ
jgi:hypothetical protein